MAELKHYTVTYQLYMKDGKPNGIPYKFPIMATSKEDAADRCLKGHLSQICKIISVKQDN